jgi:hypothetical protein
MVKSRIRGFAVMPVLVSSLLFLLLIATMLVMSRSDIAVAVDAEKELDAELYGESVVALAAADLLDGQVGMSGEFVYPPDAGEKAPQGKLTFDRFGEVPFSTNALASDVAVEGWNGVWVPKRSVHLVGVGQVGSMRVVHEAILSLDQFPFAVASAGKVRGSAMDVYAISSLEALAGGVTEDEKQPGNVVSNDGSETAVTLGTDTKVTGDVRAAGGVDYISRDQVLGEVKEGQTAQNLPILDLSVYDPAGTGAQQSYVDYLPTMTEIKDGKVRATGPLSVGDLHLDSGLLYVEGDLTITGAVTGNGAIVCSGGVTVTGQMNLESDLVALVAGGDVLIDGRGLDAGGTRMQGLVYTNGSFKAEDSTVVGAIVSAQVDGTTQLDRVNLIQVPGATNFEVVVDEDLEVVTAAGQAEDEGYSIGLEYQGSFTPFSESSSPALRELAAVLVAQPPDERGTVQVRTRDGALVNPVPVSVQNDLIDKREAWKTYLGKVKDDTVERTEIFKLDLNSFLSVQGELEVLLWKSYRQRVKEQEES